MVFPAAGLALLCSVALLRWRPEGVAMVSIWTNLAVQLGTGALTGAVWARWQAQTHFARLADGSMDPMYLQVMSTHWIRVSLIIVQGLIVVWMMIEHLTSLRASTAT